MPVGSVTSKIANSKWLWPESATLAALGVVYGDIGTSPLYALKEAGCLGDGTGFAR